MFNHQYLYKLIKEHEDWLIERVFYYARTHNYIKYTYTLRKDWRATVAGLSKTLLKALQTDGIPDLGPDENFTQDPIASFGILEAQRHRALGVSLGMFLGAMKSTCRQSYIDLVCQTGFARDYEEYCRQLIERFFDRVEIGFCMAWAELSKSEKNKYLTISESLPNPVLLLNKDYEEDITERKLAEEKLKQTTGELQAIFHALPDLYFRLDFDGTILDVRGYFSYLYLPVEKVIRKKVHDLLPSPVREQVLQAIQQALQTKSLVMIEYPLTLKDKEYFFEARILPLHESQVISIVRNITKRKWAEKLLRKSQARYIDLYENANDIIFTLDLQGNITSANKAACAAWGYTKKEIHNKSITDILSQESIRFKDILTKAIAQQSHLRELQAWEFEVITKNGYRRFMEVRARLIWEDDEIVGVQGIARDITERKFVEERLRRAEARYRMLIENLPVATYTASSDEPMMLFVSPQIKSMFGFPQEQWTKEPDFWTKQIHPDDVSCFLARFQEFRASKVPLSCEYRIIASDEKVFWVHDNAVWVAGKDGQPGYIQGIMINITERKKTEAEIVAYQEQLRSLTSELYLIEEKERRRIATDIHDYIGQTLAVSKMKLGSLQKSLINTPLTNNVNEIRQLIDEAINYTRSLTFELSPPILYDLGFEAALEWLGEQIHESHGIHFSFESDRQSKLMTDEIRIILFQAARELLFNVVKHAKAQKVDILIQNCDNNIRIEVVDDGIGFNTLICKNFSKTDGFGLFSIRERLKHLGGYFKVISEPGQGTRIVLETPLDPRKTTR